MKSIFESIQNEPGTNRKMEILAGHKAGPHSDLLKRVLYLATSPRMKYYIKQLPAYTTNGKNLPLADSIEKLLELSSRKITGHAASDFLANVLASVNPDDAYIIERIIEKDPKLGMGTTNINKVYVDLIENTPYMGAKPFKPEAVQAIFDNPNNKGYAYSQVKMDGRYLNTIVQNGVVSLESRAGEPTSVEGALFIKELEKFPDCVLNGELTIDGVSRYVSNGIISSLVSIGNKKKDGENVSKEIAKFEKEKKMSYQQALDLIRLTVWDTITHDEYTETVSLVPYHDRLVNLSALLKPFGHGHKDNPKMVSFIESKKVYNYEQAIAHFNEQLAKGQEGTILKASMGTWEDNKPNWQVKIKLELDIDLVIVGFNYGTGKNAKLISSIDAQSSDGLVFTSPTGIKEKEMKYLTANQHKLMGSIVEVKCNGLSQDKSGAYSLLHPVYKKIRDDKTTCDSLASIQAIEHAAKTVPAKKNKTVPAKKKTTKTIAVVSHGTPLTAVTKSTNPLDMID